MSPFTIVNPGDPVQSHQLDQIISAWTGVVGAGVPMALTQVSDPAYYALTVQNLDTTNTRAVNVLRSDGTPMLRVDSSGVTLGAPLNLPNACIVTADLADGAVTSPKLAPSISVGALGVTGNQTVGGTLSVSGTITTTSSVNISDSGGRINFYSGGYIADYPGGYVQISQLTVTPGSTALAGLTVNGDETINGGLSVNGAGGLSVYGNSNFSQNLGISGALQVYGNIASSTGDVGGNVGRFNSGVAINTYGSYISWGGTANTSLYMDANMYQNSHPGFWRMNKAGTTSIDVYLEQLTNGSWVLSPHSGIRTAAGSGTVLAGNNLNGQAFYVNGGAGGPTGWQTISNRAYKDGIVTIDDALSIVRDPSLHGYHYSLTPPDSDKTYLAYGFMVDEWATVAPDVTSPGEDGTTPHMMDSQQIIAILFEALKQYADTTDARLAALEAA